MSREEKIEKVRKVVIELEQGKRHKETSYTNVAESIIDLCQPQWIIGRSEIGKLKALTVRLKNGEYDGTGIMAAWIAIELLITESEKRVDDLPESPT